MCARVLEPLVTEFMNVNIKTLGHNNNIRLKKAEIVLQKLMMRAWKNVQ